MVGYFSDYIGTVSIQSGAFAGFVSKHNADGDLAWIKAFNSPSRAYLNGLAVDANNMLYLSGSFSQKLYFDSDSLISAGQSDGFMLKMDTSQQIQWIQTLGSTANDAAYGINVNSSGTALYVSGLFRDSTVIAGQTFYGKGFFDIYLAAFDGQGVAQWGKSIGGPGRETPIDISIDAQDNILLTGNYEGGLILSPNDTTWGAGREDIFLVKYNSTGQQQWLKMFGGAYDDFAKSTITDPNSNIYMAGWFSDSIEIDGIQYKGITEEDAFITKFNSAGTVEWVKVIASKFDERFYELKLHPDGELLALGMLDSVLMIQADTFSNRHFNRPTELLVGAFDLNGQYLWAQDIGGIRPETPIGLGLDATGNFYISGFFKDSTNLLGDPLYTQGADFEIFILKTQKDTTTQINEPKMTAPTALSLFPNPSSTSSRLVLEAIPPGNYIIECFNLNGQLLYIEPIEIQQQRHTLSLKTSNFPSGMVFLRLRQAGTQKTLGQTSFIKR